MKLLLGIDGGGSKTLAVVAALDGAVTGVGRAGGSNYQASSEDEAAAALRQAVASALAASGAAPGDIAAAGVGLAGFDGPEERAIVERIVDRALPSAPRFLENDSLLVLRAGTQDGVGVGVVAGTGANCIGRGPDGRRVQIGGMGPASGDVGFAADLALRTVAAAWRAHDGRSAPSRLPAALLEALGVSRLEAVADRCLHGRFDDADIRRIVPVLFSVAEAGDSVARATLEEVALRIAESAAAALRALSLAEREAVVVLGGSMLQLPTHRLLASAIARLVGERAPRARVTTLAVPPVLGGVLWAADLLGSDRAVAARVLAQAPAVVDLLTPADRG